MNLMSYVDGALRLLAPPICPGCDLPLLVGEIDFCGGCDLLFERTPKFLQPPSMSAAVFEYGGPLADAICRLKYAGRTDAAGPLGELLARAAIPYSGRIDRVVPVPLHPIRLRERGFNQTALLARPVARSLGVRLDPGIIERVRETSDQAGLSRSDRIVNVKGAFRARAVGRPGRILLIDDVRTTGATLAAAAEALLQAGVPSVATLALARAAP
jgi:ComF family protein